MKTLIFLCVLSVACTDDQARIVVDLEDSDSVSSVEVVDLAEYRDEVPNGDGFSVHLEDVALPVEIEVLPGDYFVGASQGTCQATGEHTLAAGDRLELVLMLNCFE